MRTQRNIITALGITTFLGCSGVDAIVVDEATGADGAPSRTEAADFEIRDGRVYVEGDMVIGPADEVFGPGAHPSGGVEKSAGAVNLTEGFAGTTNTWTQAQIRWRFDAAFELTSSPADRVRRDELKADFRAALLHYQERTTLRFTEITGTSGNYLNVERPDDCAANVGMVGGAQYVAIGRVDDALIRDCPVGSMMHELGHAAGLNHEHDRTDRDTYVDVNPEEFDEELPADEITPLSDYEWSSIMHYGGDDITYAGTDTPVVRNRTALTYFDIQGIQLMYGDQISPLASINLRTNTLDLFYRSATGKVSHRFRRDGAWSSGSSRGAPNNAVIMGAPVSITRDGTKIDLLVLGLDERIYHQSYNGTTWSAWAAIGTDTFRSQPAAVSRSASTINVYAIDKASGALKRNSYNGTSWSSWSSLGGVVVGTPSVVAIDKDHVDVFVLDKDKTLKRKSWTNSGGWESSFTSLGGTFRGVVTAAEVLNDQIELFGKDKDSKLLHRSYQPLTRTFTSDWVKVNDMVILGNPQVVRGFENDLQVVVAGSDRKLYYGNMLPTASSITFHSLGGTIEGSPLLLRDGDYIQAFVRTTDNVIKYKSLLNALTPTWSSSYSSAGATVSW